MTRPCVGRLLTVVILALAGCPAASAGVRDIPDIRYATTPGVEANLQSLDIYLPDPAPANPMPVVIWVHGGAWKGGDKSNKMQYKPPLFTGVGYCFVSVNYRLSPDPFNIGDPTRVMHPIHVQDVAAAIAWVHSNIASYGGDTTRMALLGHSAGGHLVSLVSTDESFLAAHGLPLTVIKGTAELDAEGLDIVAKMNNVPGNEMILNAFGDDPLVWAAASPINHLAAGKGMPPFLVATRGDAFRQGMAADFAAGVQGAGSSATTVDASVYTHEEVNENVGVPGETVITPPLMAFFAGIFGGMQPTTPFVPMQTINEGAPESSALVDLTGDGALDILVAANPMIGYARNIGGCLFQLATFWDVDGAKGWGLHDFNRDGRLDPFVAQAPKETGNGPDCTINNGNGTLTFLDRGNNALPNQRTVLFDDFDGDGLLDALHPSSSFTQNHFWSELHRGIPGDMFDPVNSIETDMPAPFWHEYVDACTGAEGEWANAWMKGCVVRDLDRDGKADVVMVAWADAGYPDPRCPDVHQAFVRQLSYRGIFVLRNMSTPGDIQFQDVSHAAIGSHAYGNTYGDWEFYAPVPFDYDLDGDLDLFVGGVTKEDKNNPILLLLRNDSTPGAIAFTNVTASAGVLNDINNLPAAEKQEIRFSDGVPIDYDNDGLVDIAFTNRHDSGVGSGGAFVYLFRNLGNGTFAELDGAASGLAQYSNALNYGDLNQDGRLDIVVHDKFITGATYVYRNATTNANHWVQLNIRDIAAGTYAFGARVTVYQAGTSTVLGTDEVRTDYSYRSKRTPILHFGLGPVTSVDVRVVRLHNGGEAWFRARAANARHTLDVEDGETDADGDGHPDNEDAFPTNPREWADEDGDGLGDNFERAIIDYSTSDDIETLDDVLPQDDFDSDARNNLREFQDGTDPLDPDSRMPTAGLMGLVALVATLLLSGLRIQRRRTAS